MNKQKEHEEKPIGALLLKYSIPAVVGMLVNALYNVVDRIFIGQMEGVGEAAIAGVVITAPIVTIIFAFCMLIGIGSTAFISIKLGEHQADEAERTLGNGVVLAVIMSVILMILGLMFANSLLGAFGGNEETIPYGMEYIRVFLYGTFFNVVGFCLTSIMRADGHPHMSSICTVIGCVLNIILDYVFIFIFDMGIGGAALATIISQAVSTLISIWFFTKGGSNLKLKKKYFKLESKTVKSILAIGLAPSVMQMAISLVQIITNNALNDTGGQVAVASMGVITSIVMLVLMPIFGINQGGQPIIGYNYGAKNYKRARQTSIISMISATVILAIGFAVIQLQPQMFINWFDGSGNIAEVAVPGIKRYTLTVPILAITIMGANYFQAIGKAKMATILSLLRQVLILIPMIYICAAVGGLTGVWYAQPISDVICTFIIGAILLREFRSYSKKLPQENEVSSL